MNCEICKENAVSKVTWGLYNRAEPMNEAALCSQHSDELWKQIKGSVNAGLMHFTIHSLNQDSEAAS